MRIRHKHQRLLFLKVSARVGRGFAAFNLLDQSAIRVIHKPNPVHIGEAGNSQSIDVRHGIRFAILIRVTPHPSLASDIRED